MPQSEGNASMEPLGKEPRGILVKLARHYGYCMGVELAINKALETAAQTGRVWTDGPIIHNKQAVEKLREHGIEKLRSDSDLRPGDTVLIRAHGVPRRRLLQLEEKSVRIVDATCPHVKRAQEIISRYTGEGYKGLVIGDPGHAEIMGILGHAHGECIVVRDISDVEKVNGDDAPFVVICQTTFSIFEIDRILAALPLDPERDYIVKTVCRATQNRQEAARELAAQVDAVLVVGGFHSANTKRLAGICRETNPRTYHIETADDITPEMLRDVDSVGITAGASTPDWIICRVVSRLKEA